MPGPSDGDSAVLTGGGDGGALCVGVWSSGGDDQGFSPLADEGTAKSFASTSGAAAASGGGWCGGDSDGDAIIELKGKGEDGEMATGGVPEAGDGAAAGREVSRSSCRYKESDAPIA